MIVVNKTINIKKCFFFSFYFLNSVLEKVKELLNAINNFSTHRAINLNSIFT